MYKILIKTKASKEYFTPYQTESEDESIDYTTESLEELAATYKSLLSEYTTEQLKPIEELQAEILVDITQ